MVAAVVLVGAVGTAAALASRPSGEQRPDVTTDRVTPADLPPVWDGQGPPPIALDLGSREATLLPWTSCYSSNGGGSCSDGMPLPPFEDAGAQDEVRFRFPVARWRFHVAFVPRHDGCGSASRARVDPDGAYSYTIAAPTTPGDYRVDVSGRGPGGDAYYSFAWRTGPAC